MNRCPITYEDCRDSRYSERGLRRLSPALKTLHPLPFTAPGLRHEAALRAGRMSIQGVQLKLSARLSPKGSQFVLVDAGGTFILKPPSEVFPELPANEDLTMRLADAAGIVVPLHGLVYARDDSLIYFIKRFDRAGRNKRLAVEDFAQLRGRSREPKYDSSMEQVAETLNFCTFPAVERVELFRRTVFCFLTGNEDMHLKNFSLLTDKGKTALSPAYVLLSSSLVLKDSEELALPLHGKRRNITRRDLVRYFGSERLRLTGRVIEKVLAEIAGAKPRWQELISRSFLSAELKERYEALVEERWGRLFR